MTVVYQLSNGTKYEVQTEDCKSRTYKELGDFVDKQGDWIFDNEAFLCQADDGECTG